jgi:hypothetical protein
VDFRAADASGEELKQTMKATVDSAYDVSWKLAYERQTRKDLDVSLVVALQSLRNDEVSISGHEVEVNDLKNSANYVIDMVETQVDGENPSRLLIGFWLHPRSWSIS